MVGAVIVVRGPLSPAVLAVVRPIEDGFCGDQTGRYYDEDGQSVSLADLVRAADG